MASTVAFSPSSGEAIMENSLLGHLVGYRCISVIELVDTTLHQVSDLEKGTHARCINHTTLTVYCPLSMVQITFRGLVLGRLRERPPSTFDLDAQWSAAICTPELSIRVKSRNLRSMLLFHLGQARTSMLFCASFSYLTNSTSPPPTSLHLACSYYLFLRLETLGLGGVTMQISVTGAPSPQSISYFRHGRSRWYAEQSYLTWLPCGHGIAFRAGAAFNVARSFPQQPFRLAT
jgi:hypothetical protein